MSKNENGLQVLPEQNDNMLVFGSLANFENAQRMAKSLCSSTIVPKNYQGETNLANCIVALEMANRIRMSPLMVMQNLYIVNGNPGWSSKFLIAALNVSGRFSPLRYEWKGEEPKDNWGCRAWATDKEGEKLLGAWVTIDMAKKEGWFGKAGSKWQTMPQLMLQYRAGAFFARTYAPEIGMGLQTAEELADVGEVVESTYIDMSEKVQREIDQNANSESLSMKESAQEKEGVKETSPVGEQNKPKWMQD
ncbi:MAG: hypothetical protein A2X18_07495 [Bacteroidetes bacterium GWF2_40_14]|nr:MAG: hypothetical protein A2X18_07495 [Bacteroidetes bacterium GWF2_40_14]